MSTYNTHTHTHTHNEHKQHIHSRNAHIHTHTHSLVDITNCGIAHTSGATSIEEFIDMPVTQ